MARTEIQKGITFTELLIVIVLLAVLGMVAVPRISRSAQNAKQNTCDTNVSVVNAAVEMYAREHNSQYPADTNDLTSKILLNTQYFPEGVPSCPLGGTYLMDPETRRVICSH
ncbi:MAG: prepilin-type N-terminal cleavage/methylation domain-containing protein [Sedimentisphaerales bacterium]|nr:prepilin-type N-terminal cleavage/methylation domain-containing protein [Sedimentisphaerales bacterium]